MISLLEQTNTLQVYGPYPLDLGLFSGSFHSLTLGHNTAPGDLDLAIWTFCRTLRWSIMWMTSCWSGRISKRLLYTGGLGKEIHTSQRGWYMKNQGAATAVKSLRVQDIPAKVKDKFLVFLFQKGKHSTWSVCLVSSEASTFYTQEYCSSPYARWYRGPPAFSGAFSRNGFCSSSRLPWHMGHMIPQILWCCKCQ